MLSVMSITSPISKDISFLIVLYSLLPNTAACSSRRGMVSCFKVATRDLAVRNLTSYLPSFIAHLRNVQAPKASIDASQKMHNVCSLTASLGVRHLSNVTLLSFFHFLKEPFPFSLDFFRQLFIPTYSHLPQALYSHFCLDDKWSSKSNGIKDSGYLTQDASFGPFLICITV